MTHLAQVHSIYDTNYRDLPAMLDKLKSDAEEHGADAMVTIFVGKYGIDVRGIGDCDIHDVASYLLAAHAYIADIILQSYKVVGEERE